MAIKLIIGLQNPGPAYEDTRHNAGAWFIEKLASQYKLSFSPEKKWHTSIANLKHEEQTCRVLLPSTFMNQSGLPTREVSQFYRIMPEEILVAHDDLDLPAGRIKLKSGGGNGGHNGLRDIIAQIGSQAFHRLRIGIGHPGNKELVLNYVLGKPSLSDRQAIMTAVDKAIDHVGLVLEGKMAEAMNQLNG